MPSEFVVAYDILDEGIGAKPFLLLFGFLAGAGIGTVVLVRAYRLRQSTKVAFVAVWLTIWVCAGGLGSGNVLLQRYRCLEWARSGDFQVVEGEVRDFQPMPPEGHAAESFTVSGVRFDYSDYDASKGAFNNAATRGGPIQAGRYFRISHHHGRILKIEIRKRADPDAP